MSSCARKLPEPQVARKLPSDFNSDSAGWRYCQEIEAAAWDYSKRQTATGWVLGVGALAAVAAGTVVGGTADSPTRREHAFIVSMPLLGAALGLGAKAAFTRADDHSVLASSASLAMNSPDKAIELCNKALAVWNGDRSAANALLQQAVDNAGGGKKP